MMNKVRRFTAVMAAVIVTVCSSISFSVKSKAADYRDYTALINEISILVNEARAEEGLAPLYLVPSLCEVAETRAEECVEKFSHTRPNGEKFITAFNALNIFSKLVFVKTGENIAAGHESAEETFEQWKNSPSHWAAIMNPNYTHIGIGVTYKANSLYGWYWTQFFLSTEATLEGQEIVDAAAAPRAQKMAGQNQIVPKGFGDINGDGMVNSFDVIALTKYVCGEKELCELQLEAGDVLQDGSVNIADVIVLRRYILGYYETFPITANMI